MESEPTPQTPDAMPSVAEVTTALEGVLDPELGVDIVTLGMVGDIGIDPAGVVTVAVKLTMSGCPLRSEIRDRVRSTVARHPSVRSVEVQFAEMDADERSSVMERARRHAQANGARPRLTNRCRTIAIGSGKGGVGKSSVTANLAIALARQGHDVGVLDADIWGFSIPRILGIDAELAVESVPDRPKPVIVPHRRSIGDGSLSVVSTGFMVDETTALMWRGLMLSKAVEQFLTDVEWGDLDYLLIDLPPGTGDVQMGLARMLPDASLAVVTTPARAAQTVAQRAVDMARRSFLPVVGVIENMSAFVCEHGTTYELFGSGGGQALAEAAGVPLLASIPLQPEVSAGNDAGDPVASGEGPAARIFDDLANALVDHLPPVTEEATVGCSDRMLAAVAAAFDSPIASRPSSV